MSFSYQKIKCGVCDGEKAIDDATLQNFIDRHNVD
jgi:uncharacterized protein YlaI